MHHMSHLVCPSCGYHVATIHGAPGSASIRRWIEGYAPHGVQPAADLYAAFLVWAQGDEQARSLLPLSPKAFGQQLARHGLESRRGSKGVRLWVVR